jgi:DNA-binding MarR family transcriptional regulator
MPKLENELRILETLERQPETTQAGLAAQLGVAVGTVNWYLKRLIKKGYVKTKQLERRNLKYLVTPHGLALKARLTREYMEVSLRVYRDLRQAARETLGQVEERGYRAVRLDGDGQAIEIFRLTCLEERFAVNRDPDAPLPEVRAEGIGFLVAWPDEATVATAGDR